MITCNQLINRQDGAPNTKLGSHTVTRNISSVKYILSCNPGYTGANMTIFTYVAICFETDNQLSFHKKDIISKVKVTKCWPNFLSKWLLFIHYKIDYENKSGRDLCKPLTNSGKMYSTCVTTNVTGGIYMGLLF